MARVSHLSRLSQTTVVAGDQMYFEVIDALDTDIISQVVDSWICTPGESYVPEYYFFADIFDSYVCRMQLLLAQKSFQKSRT